MEKKDTKFQIGNTFGGGRGVSGRRKTLDELDKMLSKEGNVKKFAHALQEGFDKDPLKFWKTYVLPVLPKDRVSAENEFTEIGEARQRVEEGIDRILASYSDIPNDKGRC